MRLLPKWLRIAKLAVDLTGSHARASYDRDLDPLVLSATGPASIVRPPYGLHPLNALILPARP